MRGYIKGGWIILCEVTLCNIHNWCEYEVGYIIGEVRYVIVERPPTGTCSAAIEILSKLGYLSIR